MSEFPRLSNREWEVLKLLLQGKSNKMIAFSLGISERTVEFHLTNIYAKFQVSSRIELILKLGNAAGGLEIEKLGYSTVAQQGKLAENRTRLDPQRSWVKFFQEAVTMIGKEMDMKKLFSQHVLVSILTALFTGATLVGVLLYTQSLLFYEIKPWLVALIITWAGIGLAVGVTGKHFGVTPRRVVFDTLLGTAMGLLMIMPLIWSVVLPLGYLAEGLGIIDPATMPGAVADNLVAILMLTIWLVVGSGIGVALLFLTFRKPEQVVAQA